MENHETRVIRAKLERVNHPSYYNNKVYITIETGEKLPIECIEVIRDMPTWKGNAIKYLWRAGDKPEEGISPVDKEIEDLNKAIWYINDRINSLKG